MSRILNSLTPNTENWVFLCLQVWELYSTQSSNNDPKLKVSNSHLKTEKKNNGGVEINSGQVYAVSRMLNS